MLIFLFLFSLELSVFTYMTAFTTTGLTLRCEKCKKIHAVCWNQEIKGIDSKPVQGQMFQMRVASPRWWD